MLLFKPFNYLNHQKQGVRIVVGNFYENFARVIFCEAYKEKMYGAKYAWIITGAHLWVTNKGVFVCVEKC